MELKSHGGNKKLNPFLLFFLLGAAEQTENTTADILSSYQVVVANILANSCLQNINRTS